MEPKNIAAQVMKNCSIANAKNWGSYSVCGLLLRLRELYRWEKKLEPWADIDHGALLGWIDAHERLWEGLADEGFVSLEMDGRRFDPFCVEEINRVLMEDGLAYGAGYTRAMRPSFFLAEILENHGEDGFHVIVLGDELARDLTAYPAMVLGDMVFMRKQPMGFYLWEKLLEARGQRGGLLRMAFQDHGYDFSRTREAQISVMEGIVDKELQVYLRHELGEAREAVFPEAEWRKIVAGHPGTRVEHFARGIRDILADTCEGGLLSHIIENRNLGSLGFYAANLSGFRKLLLPDMAGVYRKVRETDDWGLLEEVRTEGFEAARKLAEELTDLYRRNKGSGKFREEAEKLLARFRL